MIKNDGSIPTYTISECNIDRAKEYIRTATEHNSTYVHCLDRNFERIRDEYKLNLGDIVAINLQR